MFVCSPIFTSTQTHTRTRTLSKGNFVCNHFGIIFNFNVWYDPPKIIQLRVCVLMGICVCFCPCECMCADIRFTSSNISFPSLRVSGGSFFLKVYALFCVVVCLVLLSRVVWFCFFIHLQLALFFIILGCVFYLKYNFVC